MGFEIAVASRDGASVAGHIGKCADWLVYVVDEKGSVTGHAPVHLEKAEIFHYYNHANSALQKLDPSHPLANCAVVIGASAGESFVEKMHRRGIGVALTAETDPVLAVTAYLQQALSPPKPRPIGSLICKLRDKIPL